MQTQAGAMSPGFANAPLAAQAAFRSVMWAMAHPGRIEPLAVELAPPAPLRPEFAVLMLALADFETPIWLDADLARAPQIGAYLRFHTGAAIVEEPSEARFALIGDPQACPDFSVFAQGRPDYPDTAATLVFACEGFTSGQWALEGPGIAGVRRFGATPMPGDFMARWAANRALFPRGVDLVLAGAGSIAALPRSVTVREA